MMQIALIISILVSVGCYNKNLLQIPTISVEMPNREKTFSGYGTIFDSKESTRARLMIYQRTSVISTVLMDELGVPLMISKDSAGVISISKVFPPLTRAKIRIISSAVHAYLNLVNMVNTESDTIKNSTNIATTILYPKEKKALIFIRKKKFTLLVNNKSFLLNSGRNLPILKFILDKRE